MARLATLLGNRTDLAPRVFQLEREALRVRGHGNPLGWGIGFYQGDEVLIRRRPLDEGDEVDLAAVAGDVRADIVVAHVRVAHVGTLRGENTHPFRFRQWLFAQTGTLPQFGAVRDRLVDNVQEFLRSGIRGETDAEVFFHVFLSFLHDRGGLDAADPELVRDALRSSLALIDATGAEVGAEPAALNMLVSSGQFTVAVHRGGPMAYCVFSGKHDAELLAGDEPQLRRKLPELGQVHFVLLASDFDDEASGPASEILPDQRWKAVPDRAMVTLTRGNLPEIESL